MDRTFIIVIIGMYIPHYIIPIVISTVRRMIWSTEDGESHISHSLQYI